jgi:hypothetical protein
MSFGIKENPQPSGRSEKPNSPFPEPHHTKHKPTGDTSHFIKKSEHVGRGHEDGPTGHLSPFGQGDVSWPDSEPFGSSPQSGEGMGNPRPSGQPHPFNE